jgi:hypothetical protein
MNGTTEQKGKVGSKFFLVHFISVLQATGTTLTRFFIGLSGGYAAHSFQRDFPFCLLTDDPR